MLMGLGTMLSESFQDNFESSSEFHQMHPSADLFLGSVYIKTSSTWMSANAEIRLITSLGFRSSIQQSEKGYHEFLTVKRLFC